MSWKVSWSLKDLWIYSKKILKLSKENRGPWVASCCGVTRCERSLKALISTNVPETGKPKRKWEVFFDWGQKEKHSKKRHEERNKSDPKYNLWFFYFNIFFNIQQIRLITFHFSEVQRFQGFSFTWDWDLFKESKVHEPWWGLGSVQTFLDADFLECFCEWVWFSVAHKIRKHTHSKADSINMFKGLGLQRNCSAQCNRKNTFKESMGPCWICLMLPHTSCHEWICWDSARHSATRPVFLHFYVPHGSA